LSAIVGYDPAAYQPEFDTFLPHPDNEDLLDLLNR